MNNAKEQVFQLINQGDTAFRAGNYQKAEQIYRQALELAKQANIEMHFIYTSLSKTFKKTGQLVEAYRESKRALPSPVAFRNCATVLRRQAQEAKKNKQQLVRTTVLSEIYRLAVLAYLCYGSHDCKTGVAGFMFERAEYLSKRLKLSDIESAFFNNGPILEGGILSARDYKMFAEVFGPSTRIYNPFEDYAALTRDANKYLKARLIDRARLFPSLGEQEIERDIQRNVEFLRKLYPFAFND